LDRKKNGEAVHILTLVINPHKGGDAILETQYPFLSPIAINRSLNIIFVMTQGFWFCFFTLNLSECQETAFFIKNLIFNPYPLIWHY